MVSEHIGRYEIVAPLATGGMGELVLAREHGPAGFERLVVVKRILREVVEHPEMVESFLREARLVARLNHPNIVQIIELGQVEERDEYFIAMEYIEGTSVAELQVLCELLDRRLPLEVVVSIGVQACRGLEVAHDLRDADGSLVGLIHRDVTPQNLMCTTRGFVKLLDFGVAKTTAGLETTLSGVAKGKPGYFSPEQVQRQPLDRRTDIFSLGIVLWELAAGKSLFQRGGKFGTLRAIVDAQIPSLEAFGIDPRFDAIVRGALAREREERLGSAAELRGRLSEFASTQNWTDVHDSLSEFVNGVAGELVSGRKKTALAGLARELTSAESKSLAHVTSHEELAATAPTLDVAPEFLDRINDRLHSDVGVDSEPSKREPRGRQPSADQPSAGPVSGPEPPVPEPEPSRPRRITPTHTVDDAVVPPPPPGVLGYVAVMMAAFLMLVPAVVALWATPAWLPLAAFGVFVVALIGWRETRLSASMASRRWSAMLGLLVPAALLFATAAAWLLVPVRAAVAELVASLELRDTASRALFDPHPRVAQGVCRGLQQGDLQLPQSTVAEKLSSTQPDGAGCLVEQLDPNAERTDVVLNYLLPRWADEVRNAPADADQELLCQKTRWMAQAIKRAGLDRDLNLLDCALRADSIGARKCCAQAYRLHALGQRGVAMSLPTATAAVDQGGSLVADAIAQAWLDDDAVDPELRQALELDSPTMRAWVLAVECERVVRSGTASEAARPLETLKTLVGPTCELPVEIEQEQAVWAAACQWFFEGHDVWEATGDEPALLCGEVADSLAAVTFRAAASSVDRAFTAAIATDEPGRTVAERAAQARKCEEGDASICLRLAEMQMRAPEAERDVEKAFEFYAAGCEAGGPNSCNRAGYVLSVEMPKDTPGRKRAFEFYERACAMGHTTGCANQAEELMRGRFTKKDVRRARQIYSAQCDKGDGYACGGLADMYWDGNSVEPDRQRAIELWKKACARGYSLACVDLALDARSMEVRPSGIPSQTILMRRGCQVMDLGLCVRDMGARYLKGRGTPMDRERARRHFEWACELGDETGCERLR